MAIFGKKVYCRVDMVREDADLVGRILTQLGIEVDDLSPKGEVTCLRIAASKDAVQDLLDNLKLKGGICGPHK